MSRSRNQPGRQALEVAAFVASIAGSYRLVLEYGDDWKLWLAHCVLFVSVVSFCKQLLLKAFFDD